MCDLKLFVKTYEGRQNELMQVYRHITGDFDTKHAAYLNLLSDVISNSLHLTCK